MRTSGRSCYRCSAPLVLTDNYCGACGTKVARVCAHCNHEVPIEGDFCNYCGQGLPPVPLEREFSHEERAKIFESRDLDAAEKRLGELRTHLNVLKAAYFRHRIVEGMLILGVLGIATFLGMPLFEKQIAEFFSATPAQTVFGAAIAAGMLVLLALYCTTKRRQRDNDRIEVQLTRINMAESHMREVQTTSAMWRRLDPVEQERKQHKRDVEAAIDRAKEAAEKD